MIRLEMSPVKEAEARVEDWYFDLFTGGRDREWFDKEFERQRVNLEVILGSSVQDLGYNGMLKVYNNTNLYHRYFGFQKVASVADIIKTELLMRRYGKLVVFTLNRDVTQYVREMLATFNPLTLYRGTMESKRLTNIRKFELLPRHRVMIISLNYFEKFADSFKCEEAIFLESSLNAWTNVKAVKSLRSDADMRVRCMTIPESMDERIQTHFMKRTEEILVSDDPEPVLVKKGREKLKMKIGSKKIRRNIKATRTKKAILKTDGEVIDPESIVLHPEPSILPQKVHNITIFDIQTAARSVMAPLPGEPSYKGIDRVTSILLRFGVRNVSRLKVADYPDFIKACKELELETSCKTA